MKAIVFPISLLFSIVSSYTSCIADPSHPIKIGISLPLTGEASSYGEDLKNILQFSNEHIAHNRYKLLFEDDRCEGKQAATVAHKFASVDQVSYVLGLACSGALLSAAPIYEENKTLVLSSGASAPDVSKAGDYIFRTVPSDATSLNVFVDYVATKHSNVVLLSEESDYCEALSQGLQSLGTGRIKFALESLPPDKFSDFHTLLLRIKAKNPGALILNTQAEAGLATLVKTIETMKWSIPMYALYWPESPTFLKAAGKAANGLTFLGVPLVDEVATPEGLGVYKEYVAKFGELKSIPFFFVTAFNSFQALDTAIRSGKDVKSALYNLKFNGITGIFSFDQNGDVSELHNIMKKIEDGKIKTVQ